MLLDALKATFAHLKARKENQKTIIFVDNLTTLSVLADLLKEQYTLIKHTDENALNLFRTDKNIQILITNDVTAKGVDIEYCPVVLNYDLLYNAIEMEQRICRCHRQGQNADVLVINLLSQENMSDVRVLELINKRTLQFQGIFGMSDDIVGNFDETLAAVLQKRRTLADIQRDFAQNLETNKDSNAQIVSQAESVLFTTFTKDVAEKVQVSPQYIQEQADFVNRDLWEVVKFYFEHQEPRYVIDDVNQTITLPDEYEQYTLFYHWSGTRNVPYTGRRVYGMAQDFKPAAGRITLTSILVTEMLKDLECPDSGKIQADVEVPCEVIAYRVDLKRNNSYLKYYDVLFGRTDNGNLTSQEDCEKMLSLPVKSIQESEHKSAYWFKLTSMSRERLPAVVEENIKNRYITAQEKCFNTDVDLIKMKASRQKSVLEQNVEIVRSEVKNIKETLANALDRLEELKIQKQVNLLEKDLRKKEEGLFLEQMRIETAAEDEIEKLCGTDGISVVVSPIFKVQFHK